MNLERLRRRMEVLGTLALLLAVLIPLGGLPGANAEWSTSVFEEAVKISRTPDHLAGRAPFNGEPMSIRIESRTGQAINAADVRFTWSYQGHESSEGGYAFTRVNQTVMEAEIPGYPGGYTINYRIVAYDEKNHPLTSTTYSYKVIENGSWKDTDFDNNIVVNWGPKEPKNGQEISVNISSRDPLVAIQRADLLYTVNIPDQDPVDGVIYLERVNSTAMTAGIITYPPGSRISFHVEAYDQYFNKVVSDNFVYEYPRPPVLEPVFQGILFIILKDEAEKMPANGATVVFSNDTFIYRTETVNGMAFTNRTVYQGDYRIEITYRGKKETRTVSVPRQDGSFTFQFGVNTKTYQVSDTKEERPFIMEVAGLLISILFLVGLFYLAVRIRTLRESINERRKKARKRTAETGKEKWYEKLLMDEDLKGKLTRSLAVLLLALLGLFWAPFYPWWMVIILAAFLTGVAIKYPYISLLVMAVLVTASASYQSTEFGWVFLVFSLVVMVGGFFDWKYAYLSYLTVFAAGYGLGFTVPMIAAVAFSLFMGTVVLITVGLFLLVISPSGTFNWFSFLASPSHDKSFVRFNRGVDPHWSPVSFANEIGSLTHVDMNVISTVLQDTMGSLVPLFGLLAWALAMLAVYLIYRKWMKGDLSLDRNPRSWAMRSIPAGIILLFGIISILWAGTAFSIWMIFPFLAVLPASLLPFGVRAVGEEALPMEYGVEEIRSSEVGKKISEMVGFRKASFKEIGGLEEVKREVKNSLMVPLLEPEMATRYGVKPSKGIMLFGPPGCGKTLMLRAVASDLNVEMIGIKCSDVMSKWYGESENLIASLFEEARARAPCILFLDEIDSIAKRRDFYSTDDVTPRVLSIMLSEMDGMDEAEGIIVVGTTNMPDLVDPALMRPGRFDKVIYVPPPDRVSREEILKIHMRGKYIADDIDISKIAARTKGFSGADIANLVREASSMGLERALASGKPQPITMKDLSGVLDEIKPSITSKMYRMYDKMRREYERKRLKGDRENKPQNGRKNSKKPGRKKSGPITNGEKNGTGKKDDIIDIDELEREIDEFADWEDE